MRRKERFKGLTIGLDLHKKFIQYSVLDQAGDEIDAGRILPDKDSLLELINRLSKDQPVQVVMEASGCFYWVYQFLSGHLDKQHIHVAAPSKVQVIAQSGEKNDANDAWWLAYLLYEGRLPKAFVAEGDLRELRIACREYRSAVDTRSDAVRRMRSHMAQLGINLPKSAFSSKKGRANTAHVVKQVLQDHGMLGKAIAVAWKLVKTLIKVARYWESQVKKFSKKLPQVQVLDDNLPGVGHIIAATICSELGDPARFRSAKAYAKATGLTPGYRESGGHKQKSGITKSGSNHVRWAITRSIIGCTRCCHGPGVAVKQWVEKVKKRKPKKAAIVAAARKQSENIWRLFALGEAFDAARAFGGKTHAP